MEKLSKQIQARFEEMCKTGKLYRSSVDGETLFKFYMMGFGEDPIFRSTESSVHNCNYCHNFIRRYGNVVALDNNLELMTMFDIPDADDEYKESLKLMAECLRDGKIQNIFTETYRFLSDPKTPYEPGCKNNQIRYRLGVAVNTKRYTKEDVDRWPNSGIKVNDVIDFRHMHTYIPKEFIDFSGRSIEEIMAGPRQWRDVFKRSMEEISLDTLILVKDLEAQGSLLNGISYKNTIDLAIKCAQEYNLVDPKKRDNWLWKKTRELGPSCTFRNTAIGTLMVDLAQGREINEACREFNKKVDPTNYMKATAPITKKQIEEAEKFVVENGYEESFDRRCATLEDIKVCDILHSNQDAAAVKTKVSVFDKIAPSPSTRHKKSEFKGIEEVNIDKFMKDILPGCSQVELYLTGNLKNNFVTLLTSVNKDSKPIFKWNNNFSWTYCGNLAGKSQIKAAVKSAGGFVDAPFRFSIMWNYDSNSEGCVDLDAHAYEPEGDHIYYASHKGENHKTRCGGCLDIDMIRPRDTGVENIYYRDMKTVKDGDYKFCINNCDGGNNKNTKAEIFVDGVSYQYLVPQKIAYKGTVEIATVTMKAGQVVNIKQSKYLTGGEDVVENIYGLDTCEFHKVNLVCLSPNYWQENGVGNKHYFFMLENAQSPDEIRSIHNEYLSPDLLAHRKVMEVLGARLKVKSTKNQLSGVGFNATVRDEVILRLSGSHKRVVKVKF
jgi:hypothetical protein